VATKDNPPISTNLLTAICKQNLKHPIRKKPSLLV